MAKIVDVKYGLTNIKGGKAYKYVVNDNVKRGSVLMPVVTHYVSGKKFTTMGVVQHSYSGGGANGKRFESEYKKLVEELGEKGKELKFAEQPTKQMLEGLKTKNAQGQYVKSGLNGFSNKTTLADGTIIVGDESYQNKKPSSVVQGTRQQMLVNESYNTSQFNQPTENESFSAYFKANLQGKKL